VKVVWRAAPADVQVEEEGSVPAVRGAGAGVGEKPRGGSSAMKTIAAGAGAVRVLYASSEVAGAR